jgi:hypothetical protein
MEYVTKMMNFLFDDASVWKDISCSDEMWTVPTIPTEIVCCNYGGSDLEYEKEWDDLFLEVEEDESLIFGKELMELEQSREKKTFL